MTDESKRTRKLAQHTKMAPTKLIANGHDPLLKDDLQGERKSINGHSSATKHPILQNGFSKMANGKAAAAAAADQYCDKVIGQNGLASTSGGSTTSLAPSTASSTSKSAQALIEVRKQFLEYAKQNPDKVNERDVRKLATDDWYLKRYLLARNRRVKDTMNMLRKTMEWRNEFGIHISEDAMFPQEFYKIGALFPYENDKKGNLVLYLRIKYHRKIDEMVEVEKHFLVHTFEKIDRITNGQGLVIVFDCQGAGYANCDVEFLQFLITCATEHAPIGLQYIIVYKLPWILNAFWSIAKNLLPAYLANRVRFCDERSVREFIDPQNLPDFMEGNCKRNYRWIPAGCPSVFKLANAHGITDAEIEKILPQFQPLLDEAEEAMNTSTYESPPEAIIKYVNNPQTAPNLLSDIALCSIGLGSGSSTASDSDTTQSDLGESSRTSQSGLSRETLSLIRLFPDEFVEFNYDAYNDAFHATVTIFNPNEKNSLAFKLMSNRPSNYSVKPARGVLAPNAMLTISIVLLNEYKANDKFLIIAQPLEGEIRSISKSQFDSLWSPNITSSTDKNAHKIQNTATHTTIKLGSYLRKIVTTPALQSTIKNPQVYELVSTCRSLKRRQNLSIMINIILLVIIINLLLFN